MFGLGRVSRAYGSGAGQAPRCHRSSGLDLNRAGPPDSDSGAPQRLASLRERSAGLLAVRPWPHAHCAWLAFGVPALMAWLPCVAVKIHRDCAPAACNTAWHGLWTQTVRRPGSMPGLTFCRLPLLPLHVYSRPGRRPLAHRRLGQGFRCQPWLWHEALQSPFPDWRTSRYRVSPTVL